MQQCSRSSTVPYLDPSQDGDTNDPSEPEPMELDEQHNEDNEEGNDGADQEDNEEHGGGYLGCDELGEDDDREEGHFGDSDEEEIIVVVKTVADVQSTAYSRSTTLKLHEEAEEPHNVVVRGRQRCFWFEMDEILMGVIRAHPYLQGLF